MSKFFFITGTFIFIFFYLSCEAQKPLSLNLLNAARGNTGFRGRIPDEDKDKPLKGNVFVDINLMASHNCDIDSVFVNLKDPEIRFRDVSQNYPKHLKADETWNIRIENKEQGLSNWDNNRCETCEGFMDFYSGGKKYTVLIKNFKSILPK